MAAAPQIIWVGDLEIAAPWSFFRRTMLFRD
jgi:hypothetical protein